MIIKTIYFQAEIRGGVVPAARSSASGVSWSEAYDAQPRRYEIRSLQLELILKCLLILSLFVQIPLLPWTTVRVIPW